MPTTTAEITTAAPASPEDRLKDWWSTSIVDIEPGRIAFRGYPIEQLIGRIGFAEMVWLMVRGALPSPAQAALLEACLVAGVDHGPQAPSIAIARMAMTCGVDINNAMASATNVLGDVHGGAGQAALELYLAIDARQRAGAPLAEALEAVLRPLIAARQPLPGFGHRFHPVDPRAPRLIALAREAVAAGTIGGAFVTIGLGVEDWLAAAKNKRLTMNIDGVTAVIFAELGFSPMLARGLFILSRSVGIMAHAHEQAQQGGRIKGPTPPAFGYRYTGPGRGSLAEPD